MAKIVSRENQALIGLIIAKNGIPGRGWPPRSTGRRLWVSDDSEKKKQREKSTLGPRRTVGAQLGPSWSTRIKSEDSLC